MKNAKNRQRKGARKTRRAGSKGLSNNLPVQTVDNDGALALPSPASATQTTHDGGIDAIHDTASQGFIASDSVLSYQSYNLTSRTSHPNWKATENFLRSKQRDHPLKEPLQQALIDSFRVHLRHLYPVIQDSDNGPSDTDLPLLLRQSLCMAGSLIRRIGSVEDLVLPHTLYQAISGRIYEDNHQEGSITVLKAMYLLSCWSLRPPYVVSLEGPWHWIGMAIRHAIQIGLHRESTYAQHAGSDCCRQIWWGLVVGTDSFFLLSLAKALALIVIYQMCDTLTAACWGRPLIIRSEDHDVQLPKRLSENDIAFQVSSELTRVILILRKAIEPPAQPLLDTVALLHDWLVNVPPNLQLYDSSGRRKPYLKPVNEIYITYFAIIVFISFKQCFGGESRVSVLSIVASSCMIRLYEEIYLREQSHHLIPIHGFFLMLAAIPQIFFGPRTSHKERLRQEHINVITSILEQLRVKYGGCDMILRKITRLVTEAHNGNERNDLTSEESILLPRHQELFPFPMDLSPNLDLFNDDGLDFNNAGFDFAGVFHFDTSLLDWSFDNTQLPLYNLTSDVSTTHLPPGSYLRS